MLFNILSLISYPTRGHDGVTQNFKRDLSAKVVRNFTFLYSKRLGIFLMEAYLSNNEMHFSSTLRLSSTFAKIPFISDIQLSENFSIDAIFSFNSDSAVSPVSHFV